MRITTTTPGYCQCSGPYVVPTQLPIGPGVPVGPVNWPTVPTNRPSVLSPAPTGNRDARTPAIALATAQTPRTGPDRRTASGRRIRQIESQLTLTLSGPRPFTLRESRRIDYLQNLVDQSAEKKSVKPLARFQTPEQRAEATVSGMLIA